MKHITFVFLLITTNAFSQTEQKAPEYGWKNSMVAGLNLTQVSLNNWTQGGQNTIAWTFLLNGKFLYDQADYIWTNNLKLSYGQTKLGSADFEKSDDELFFESIYAHNVGWKVNPYAALTLKTQMSAGYKMIEGKRTKTSDLFDPGYLMQSAGFTYTSGEVFSTRLGIAIKESFTSNFSSYGYADDPKTVEIEKTRVQTGLESASDLKIVLMENVQFKSSLSLFTAFQTIDVWDVRWDNTITAKVNNYVNVSLNALVIHEIAQTRRTQLKETLALGLSYTLF